MQVLMDERRLEIVETSLKENLIVSSACNYGRTDLLNACAYGNLSAVKFLLKEGLSNIKEVDKTGKTAFIWAVIGGHDKIVSFLLQEGANIQERDKNDETALIQKRLLSVFVHFRLKQI